MITNPFFVSGPNSRIKTKEIYSFKTILPQNINTIMSLEVSNSLQKYKNIHYRFSLFSKNIHLTIRNINEHLYDKYNHIMNSNNNILLYQNIIQPYSSLYEYLYLTIKSPNDKFYLFVNMFKYLSHSLHILQQETIVLLNISPYTIITNGDIPVINNLFQSFIYNNLSHERIKSIFNKTYAVNIFLPIEYHVILFLNNYIDETDTINEKQLITICDDFVGKYGLRSLNLFSCDSLKEYKEEAYFYLSSLLQKTKTDIIQNLLQKSYTWNNYQTSIIFLLFLRDFFIIKLPTLLHSNSFISHTFSLLSQNIHFDSSKRGNETNNILCIDNILNNTSDSTFYQLFYLR